MSDLPPIARVSALPFTGIRRGSSLLWLAFALLLLGAPWLWQDSFARSLLCQMGIALIACLAYNILFGQAGLVSFGHAVYSGLGAFAGIHALQALGEGRLNLPLSLVPLAGGLAGLLAAALLGSFSVRRAGTPFAMISLGVVELVYAAALMLPEYFGGEGGLAANRVVGPPVLGISFGPQIEVYYLIALYALVCTVAVHAITRTPFGRMLQAVRDNPARVEFIGYSAARLRFTAFVLSGFFSGVAGGLAAILFELVTPEVLSTTRSAAYLLFVFLGGATLFAGPIIGAVLMVLALVLLSELTQAWLLYLGMGFLLMVIFAPAGIAGLVQGLVARVMRGGPSWCWSLLQVMLAVLFAAAGLAVLVEMLYHRQLSAAMSPRLAMLGVAWDVEAPVSWLIATAWFVAGGAASLWSWRRNRATLRMPATAARA